MSKLGILMAAGAGYVLGARAGRERYDQIQQQARRVWSDPRVQKAKRQASDAAQEKASQATDIAREKVSTANDFAHEKVSEVRDKGQDTPEPRSPGSHAAPHPNPNDMPAHPATEHLDD